MSTHEHQPILRTILGGTACVCAGTATHPIDTVKIRLQKDGEGNLARKYKTIIQGLIVIFREEGILALYKGLSASILREATYSTIRLGLYEPFKNLLSTEQKTPFYVKFFAGVMSGSTGATFANPCDLLKVRLQSIQNGKQSLIKEFTNILHKEGIKGLYKGTLPNVLRGAILTGTQLGTYDHSKQMLKEYFHFKEGYPLHFVCAFTTGFVLTLTTSPMDLMKTRIMSQEAGHRVYSGLVDCAIKTYQKEGILAFYKGFFPQWFRFGPFTIIQFLTWEKLRSNFNISNI